MTNQTVIRKRVHNFYLAHQSKSKSFTVAHFKLEGIPKSTIYRIIGQAEKGIGYVRKTGSGRKAKIMSKNGISMLIKTFDHSCGIFQTQAARKCTCSQQFISKTLKNKTD